MGSIKNYLKTYSMTYFKGAKQMTHPLGLSPEYIKIDKNRRVSPTVTVDTRYTAATELGYSINAFLHKSTRNRAKHLLGKGDVLLGHEVYERIAKDVKDAFLKACETLDSTLKGYETFNSFTKGKYNTYTLMRDTQRLGIHQHKKLIRVHALLKDFVKFEALKKHPLGYIAIEDRVPLTRRFVMKYYWTEKMTFESIAKVLVVPEGWVKSEIKRLELEKKKNGIKLRGKLGWKMTEAQKVKHQNQPHARAVVQMDPRTFEVLREFNSTGAVERDGWLRENVRKAIKSAGLHDGFLWAYRGEEEAMIKRVKEHGNLDRNLKIWENGHITREEIQNLYIDQDMSLKEVAEVLGCNKGSVAVRASMFKLTKRKNISDERLTQLYVHEGLSVQEIAEQEGYKVTTIRTYLSRRNIRKMA